MLDTASSENYLAPIQRGGCLFYESILLVAIMSIIQSWLIYSVAALVLVVILDYTQMLYKRRNMVNLTQLGRRQNRIANVLGCSPLGRDHGLSLETPFSCLRRSHGI